MRETIAPARSDKERRRDDELAIFKRYMHMRDCTAIASVWSDKWHACPVCGGRYDLWGVMQHRPKVEC